MGEMLRGGGGAKGTFLQWQRPKKPEKTNRISSRSRLRKSSRPRFERYSMIVNLQKF